MPEPTPLAAYDAAQNREIHINNPSQNNNGRAALRAAEEEQEDASAIPILNSQSIAGDSASRSKVYNPSSSTHLKKFTAAAEEYVTNETSSYRGSLPEDHPGRKAGTVEVFMLLVFPDGTVKRSATVLFTEETNGELVVERNTLSHHFFESAI